MESLQAMSTRMRWPLLPLFCALGPGCNPADKSVTSSPSAPLSGTPSMSNNDVEPMLLSRIAKGDLFTRDELEVLQNRTNLVAQLEAAFSNRPPQEREELVDFLTALGKSADTAQMHVLRADVVRALVATLADPESAVRDAASRVLANDVPDALIRNHAEQVVRRVEQQPTMARAAFLLGRVGSERAKALIDNGTVAGVSAEDLDIVRAKLGDSAAEDRSIERYRAALPREGEVGDVARWTEQLGYLATPRAVLALARDVRHPGTYVWRHGSKRMVRADVVQALAKAFPYEAHPHLVEPEDDGGYDRVERWVTAKLGVTWTEPRPAFVPQAPAVTY